MDNSRTDWEMFVAENNASARELEEVGWENYPNLVIMFEEWRAMIMRGLAELGAITIPEDVDDYVVDTKSKIRYDVTGYIIHEYLGHFGMTIH